MEIRRNRVRIAKRRGTCAICGKPYFKGDETAVYDLRRNVHLACLAKDSR